MKKITEQHFYDLLSLKLSGDATAEDLGLLQQQLLLHPQWQFLYDQMMVPPAEQPNATDHTQQAYAAHFVKMQLQGKFENGHYTTTDIIIPTAGKALYRRLLYAAVAACVTGIIFFITFLKPVTGSSNKNIPVNEVATKKGSKSNIKLPDGTQVWLNADSKLSYAENFVGTTREVTLTGEAYFDVVHDAAHPFIIHAGRANIKVLGTAFNIRNYPLDKSLETTLMRGKIEVWFDGRPDEKIVMKPLEKLIINKDSIVNEKTNTNNTISGKITDKIVLTGITYAPKDSTVSETSWMEDKMVFINQPLQKIAEELERNFDVTVTFRQSEVKNFRFTGVFDNVNLDNVLQILHLSNKKFNYKIEDKNITIY